MRYASIILLFLLLSSSLRSQPSTDIFLMDINVEYGKIELDNVQNITNRKGYDNQPAFDESCSYIYYTSIRDSQSNVYLYDILNKKTRQLTFTAESEYSPTPMIDGSFSSVRVDLEGLQHLWLIRAYPYRAEKVFDDITGIGYHEWLNENELALFIVGKPHELHIAQRDKGISKKVAESIGSAIHKVPGKHAIAYMDLSDSSDCRIKVYDIDKESTKDICACAQDSEYFIMIDENRFLSGSGAKLMMFDTQVKTWEQVADLSAYKGLDFYRLSLSPDKKKLALVSRMPD